MKIGIMTLSASDNCGSLLQAYALKRLLEGMKEHQVEVINFSTEQSHSMYDILYRISKNVKKVFYNPNPKYFWVDREESAVHKLKCEDLYCAVEVQRKTLEDGFIKKLLDLILLKGMSR